MIGISNFASYLPDQTISNLDLIEKFNLSESFITDKIGVLNRRIKSSDERSSDLCVKAFDALAQKENILLSDVDCCVVITQNPDYNLPHTSAIVHERLGLPNTCSCFDISLGCSGFVYGLSIVKSFMEANNFTNGLLFTSDQYSDIIDKNDKNTILIFGDGSTVTHLTDNPVFSPLSFRFGTNGNGYKELINDEKLFMNGRAVFNFTAKTIPTEINLLIEQYEFSDDDIDLYVLHQGSKYIVDTIAKRLKVDEAKVVFDMKDYGNLISSSIPIILEKYLLSENINRIVISGFGVGLSWATTILERTKGT